MENISHIESVLSLWKRIVQEGDGKQLSERRFFNECLHNIQSHSSHKSLMGGGCVFNQRTKKCRKSDTKNNTALCESRPNKNGQLRCRRITREKEILKQVLKESRKVVKSLSKDDKQVSKFVSQASRISPQTPPSPRQKSCALSSCTDTAYITAVLLYAVSVCVILFTLAVSAQMKYSGGEMLDTMYKTFDQVWKWVSWLTGHTLVTEWTTAGARVNFEAATRKLIFRRVVLLTVWNTVLSWFQLPGFARSSSERSAGASFILAFYEILKRIIPSCIRYIIPMLFSIGLQLWNGSTPAAMALTWETAWQLVSMVDGRGSAEMSAWRSTWLLYGVGEGILYISDPFICLIASHLRTPPTTKKQKKKSRSKWL